MHNPPVLPREIISLKQTRAQPFALPLQMLLQHASNADSLASASDVLSPLKDVIVDAAQPCQSAAVQRRGFD